MTIIYTVDAFDRVDELLVFEGEVPKENFPRLVKSWGGPKRTITILWLDLGAGTLLIKSEGSFEIFPAAAGRIILFKQGTLTTEAGLTL
jgi:hypothetical protein